MSMNVRSIASSIVFLLACTLAWDALCGSSESLPRVGGDYVFSGDIEFGAPGAWDYITLDNGRLYLGHADKVTVVDVATKKIIGSVSPISRSHGVAIVPALRKGYATSGGDGVLKVFSLENFKISKEIPVGKDADGVIFDVHTNSVIVMIGDGQQVVTVDPRTDTVVHSVMLPGNPEFAAVDGRGKVFVNIESSGHVAKIDIASGHIDAVWPLAGCKSPHGLAYDSHSDRLFSGCANKVLVVVDPSSGKNVATLPIGAYSDGVGIDVSRHRVFSPNGDGTLTVINEGANDKFSVLRTTPTFLGGRSMAIDPRNGTLFITHGDTKIKSPRGDFRELRFGWDNAEVAMFAPND